MIYTAFDPESKVIGQAMLGFQAAADQAIIKPLMIKHGLVNIQPDQWYPLQKWLDVLSGIDENADKIANMLTFVDIGRKVAESVYIPEEADRFAKEQGYVEFMHKFATLTFVREHQGEVGQYTTDKLNDHHIRFTIMTPYPPDVVYGVIHGFATRYAASFVVQYEDLAMRNPQRGEPVIIHAIVRG